MSIPAGRSRNLRRFRLADIPVTDVRHAATPLNCPKGAAMRRGRRLATTARNA
jgi:hypothetical protein